MVFFFAEIRQLATTKNPVQPVQRIIFESFPKIHHIS
jgi:hypothetical protein